MIDPTTATSIRGLRTKPIWIKPEIESAVDRLGSTWPRPILHVVDAPVASIHHTFESNSQHALEGDILRTLNYCNGSRYAQLMGLTFSSSFTSPSLISSQQLLLA